MPRDIFGLEMELSAFGDRTLLNIDGDDNPFKRHRKLKTQILNHGISDAALSSHEPVEAHAELPVIDWPEAGPFMLQSIINLKLDDRLDWQEVDKILGLDHPG